METDARRVKPETENLIREAADGLRLRDVILYESRLFRECVLPDVEDFEALQQHKRGVKFSIGKRENGQNLTHELHVLVSLGERVVDNAPEDDPRVYFGVEADYLVVYDMLREVSEEALKAFADFNAVHNVWPFWRQHVFDLIGQARLTPLQIPLFSGNGQ